MATCSIYFNDNEIRVHTNMVYEPGPIYFADSDIQSFSRNSLDMFIIRILELLNKPEIIIPESNWFDKNWINSRRKEWLKIFGVKSNKDLSFKYKLIEISKTNNSILFIPTIREGEGYKHKSEIKVNFDTDISSALNRALNESE